MSTVKVNTLTGVGTAGSIAVTGEGNSTTTNLQQGLAKSWVDFITITSTSSRDSFNVSGLADNGPGNTTISFTSNMGSANFAAVMYTGGGDTSTNAAAFGNQYAGGLGSKTSSSVTHVSFDSNYADSYKNDVVVQGDLA